MTSRNLRLGHSLWFAVALLLMGCGIAQAQELEGTWRLVMRKLPDGTTQVPPAVLGAYTAYKGLQNLSGTEYTATLLVLALDDGSGKPTTYNLTGATESTPVTREGGRLAFKLPFGEPSVVFEGDKFTATAEGQFGKFVDYWERVH